MNAKKGTVELAMPDTKLAEKVQQLQAEQKSLATRKKEITQELRNAERRSKRLRLKARLLTDDDLVSVLMMRKETREARAGNDSKQPGKKAEDKPASDEQEDNADGDHSDAEPVACETEDAKPDCAASSSKKRED